jgi:hypothetical protein
MAPPRPSHPKPAAAMNYQGISMQCQLRKNDLAYYLIAFRFDLDKKKNGYLGTNNYNYMKSKDNLKYKKYIY